MITTTLSINNQLGLHARASAKFVATAAKYQSSLQVTKNNQSINGKSIMAVMMLAATKGEQIILEVDGPDEREMMQALTDLINNKFNEE